MPECLLARGWQEEIDEVIVTLPQENSTRIQEIVAMLKGLPLQITLASSWPVLIALDLREACGGKTTDL